jgi:ERF superfamily
MTMTLKDKIWAIQCITKKVRKKGVNPEQGWEYLRIEDAVGNVKKLMNRYKLILTPELVDMKRTANEKGSGYVIDIVMAWTLEDVESGEKMTYRIPGSGWDYNDKGVFKAMTGSRKYAIVLIFNLAVGNDVEERGAIARDNAKDRQHEIAEHKIANVEAGKGVDADTPALFYVWIDQSKRAFISGDATLLKLNADLLKPLKLGRDLVADAVQLEELKLKLEGRGVLFKRLAA